MTLHIELNEEAEQVDLLVDDHLVLRAERRSPSLITYKNFDALVDDRLHDAIKEVATILLHLTDP